MAVVEAKVISMMATGSRMARARPLPSFTPSTLWVHAQSLSWMSLTWLFMPSPNAP